MVANTVNLFPDGAVGFIDWLDLENVLVITCHGYRKRFMLPVSIIA